MDALRMWKPMMDSSHPGPPDAVLAARDALNIALTGDWRRAESMLLGAVGPLEQAEAPEAAAANHNLAALLHERGDSDGAVFHCVRGLFLYNRARDLGGIYLSLRNLAMIHADRGETGYATSAQQYAARARRELDARGLLPDVERGRDSRGERLHKLERGSRGRALKRASGL